MILEEKVKDLVVVGEDTSKKAKISGDKLAKLQYLLTKGLYKDPITAVIAEWTNNGIDAVVQAGKSPIDTPVLVKINKDGKGQYIFSVEDKGTGLDDRDFEDVCMNYLESTKESDNDTIGHFGIGMKSFLSLERSATFTCRKNGIERKYLVYEGAEFVNFDLIYEKPTTEENGVLAELMINNWNERQLFVDKAKNKLAYYDTAVLIVDNAVIPNQIYRNDLFQWSDLASTGTMHLCLKDVYYSIDWEALGIKEIPLPVAIRLQLGDGLTPTPSRESYITNEKTKDLLIKKIKEIANWFVTKYNETIKEFPTFLDAYDYLGELNLNVNLEGDNFLINCLLPYSSHKPETPKVKGIILKDPLTYKIKRGSLLQEYTAVGYMTDHGKLKTKEGRLGVSKEGHILVHQRKTVQVAENFRGNVREFLKEKYGSDTLYVRRNSFQRRLGGKGIQGANGQMRIDVDSYVSLLDLAVRPKGSWRKFIDEWNFVVSSIVSTFIDERKVENTKEYLDWLDEKRELQKLKRKEMAISGNYQGLGKQVGDVTLAYHYTRYGKIHFKKEAFPISGLHENKFLTVLLTEEDDLELAKGIAYSLKSTVQFALVGKKEIRKVPDHFQFINFKKFMSRDCKPFMRLASAVKFQEVLDHYKNIKNYKNPVFQHSLRSLNADAGKLNKYVEANLAHNLSDALENIIIDVADQHNLYDLELWPEYMRLKENVHKYDFISFMSVPSYSNQELIDRYDKLVNQILLFRKKYYNDLPKGAKIVFD
jgi:hypothetical protein